MEGSQSHCADERPREENDSVDEIQIENELLERYLLQRNVKLPSDWATAQIPHHEVVPVDFKLQIAIETLSHLNNTIEARREASNKLISTLKVMLNEADLRIADIQRDAHEFQRDVVDGGRCANNPDRYRAEKFVRYMDGKLYDQESALDKLRLKNQTLMNRKRKLEAQLSREEETSFHFIDFHQVKPVLCHKCLSRGDHLTRHNTFFPRPRNLQMQIRLKQDKKVLEAKASKVALRKIASEKSKQKIDALQAQLQELKSKSKSNEKAVALREAYLERLDELVYAKEDEVDGLKNILKNKESPDQVLEDEPTGPDVMEVSSDQRLTRRFVLRPRIPQPPPAAMLLTAPPPSTPTVHHAKGADIRPSRGDQGDGEKDRDRQGKQEDETAEPARRGGLEGVFPGEPSGQMDSRDAIARN